MKLVKFFMKLGNETVTIELKNGTVVVGTLSAGDMAMNVHLKAVKLMVKGQPSKQLDHITLRGSHLRYFLLPEAINLDTLLVDDGPKQKRTIAQARAIGHHRVIQKGTAIRLFHFFHTAQYVGKLLHVKQIDFL